MRKSLLFAFTFIVCKMKIFCVICYDLLSEDIFFTPCGHVFHHHCLLQWLERSETCPHCCGKTTISEIRKAYFTFFNAEIVASDAENLYPLQGKIDNLKFQILLKENNIKHYTSRNMTLKKEVQRMECEIGHNNEVISVLKKEISNLRTENLSKYESLKKKLLLKEKEKLQEMHKILLMGTLKEVQEMVGEITYRSTFVDCISVMKEVLLKKTDDIKSLQDQLAMHRESLMEKRFKNLEFEGRLTNENSSPRHRIKELETSARILHFQEQTQCILKCILKNFLSVLIQLFLNWDFFRLH